MSKDIKRLKVVVCQHRLLHYRVGFFDLLRKRLAERDIELVLVHGQATIRELKKKDEGSLSWAVRVVNKYFFAAGRDVLWQPFPKEHFDADLIVLMQESRIISNYPIILRGLIGLNKVAYWGHGINFQSANPNGLREHWKRFMLTRVDWWFAYTEMTVNILRSAGFSQSKITCLNNAIDNDEFVEQINLIAESDIVKARACLNLVEPGFVAVFCGSLYKDKRLDFMIAAADIVSSAVEGFRLVVIGDGELSGFIEEMASTRPWLNYVGQKRGLEKAAWFRVADVVLNPGLVGLHILDAFWSGLPIVTTSSARHSPEISYIQNNVNGIVVDGGVDLFASEVIGLAHNKERLESLSKAAFDSASKYTISNMANNFVAGCVAALSDRVSAA